LVLANRETGEVLPDTNDFRYFELGAFAGDGFKRNVLAQSGLDVQAWRKLYADTGIFRTVLFSNDAEFITNYKELRVLFHGNFAMDFDVSKNAELESEWPRLIAEVEGLAAQLYAEIDLAPEQLQIWFSGSRGIHLEIPWQAVDAWPDHDLHRVYGHWAKDLTQRLGLHYLDPCLYSARHLYRLENSIHQKTKLYKIPLRFSELSACRKHKNMKEFAKGPRRPKDFWKIPSCSTRGSLLYDRLYRESLTAYLPKPQERRADNSSYNRSNWTCIETAFSDGYMIEKGYRHSVAFLLASHFKQEGFTLEQAEAELEDWSLNHCDPPVTDPADRAHWLDTLQREYRTNNTLYAGCSYVQGNIPHLCQETICPIGQMRLKLRQSRTSALPQRG
jgi:hypothetical protein